MFTPLHARLKRASRWLPVALLSFAAQAQNLNYGSATAANVAGTYTDLGTAGTAIARHVRPDTAQWLVRIEIGISMHALCRLFQGENFKPTAYPE